MRGFRGSLRGLVVLVAMCAVSFGVTHTYFISDEPVWQVAVSLVGVVLQVELYLLVVRGRRLRPFWVGFLATGSLLLASFVWALFTPSTNSMSKQIDPKTGRTVYLASHVVGSRAAMAWEGYGSLVSEGIERLPRLSNWLMGDDHLAWMFALGVVVMLLPHVLLPCLGGLLACGCCAIAARSRAAPATA